MDAAVAHADASRESGRGLLWLPLLQRVTLISATSVVWKNASATLDGHGDLDVIAPPADWQRIETEFRRWATSVGLSPVVVCRHVPGSMFLLAADPTRDAFFELDIKGRGSYRGVTICRGADVLPLSELDSRGFRRLRPGAEGLLKLILNGTADDGSLNEHRVKRERIVELLTSDPDGVERAARLFGSTRGYVLTLVRGFLRGEWDRATMLKFRGRLRLALLSEPLHLAHRAWSLVGPGRHCPGVKALIKDGRLVPGDLAALQNVVRAHGAAHGVSLA